MKTILLTNLLSVFFTFVTFAQTQTPLSSKVTSTLLKKEIESGLLYLSKTQRKETISDSIYKGEWQTLMCLRNGFLLLGKKKKIEDSNCFSVASTHNFLARIYLNHPEYKIIQPMLDLSFEKIMSYKNGTSFNFWNALQPYRDLEKGDTLWKNKLVRRPTNYPLRSRYINNAANIQNDADDTSLAIAAIFFKNKIANRDGLSKQIDSKLNLDYTIFSHYRDSSRKNRHWYNYLYGNDHETGAFLTWLGNEYEFKNWNIVKVIGHNATFYLPFSECFPHAYKPYIPYGSNDLDAVVNANVITALALTDNLNQIGVKESVKYIEKKSCKRNYNRTGFYYPNQYHFPYAVLQAYNSGGNQLEKAVENICSFLIKTQQNDGSWVSKYSLNRRDRLQSTAYAVSALVYAKNPIYNEYIENGIQYILSKAIEDENGKHWEGGVFFAGGTVVRKTLTWRSDAYTTALILNAFSGYSNYLEQ